VAPENIFSVRLSLIVRVAMADLSRGFQRAEGEQLNQRRVSDT